MRLNGIVAGGVLIGFMSAAQAASPAIGATAMQDVPLSLPDAAPNPPGQPSGVPMPQTGLPGMGEQAQMLPPPPVLIGPAIDTEAARLHGILARSLPRQLGWPAARENTMVAAAQNEIAKSGKLAIDRPQLVVVVDRNPRVQALMIVLARNDAPWQVIGSAHVSTGQPGRKLYYITPTGVFMHTADILDYRAEGTFNENHIRGLGLKGMRVWDFGWQWATKGWRSDGEQGQIRLEMHATDPQYLEQRIGRPASEGCVRVPAALNRFMDQYGVLDVDYEAIATQDARYRAVLLKDRTPTPLAGHALVVIDSANPA